MSKHASSGQVPCGSCGATAEVRLRDGSFWCLSCNESANRLGYDNQRGRLIRQLRLLGGGESMTTEGDGK